MIESGELPVIPTPSAVGRPERARPRTVPSRPSGFWWWPRVARQARVKALVQMRHLVITAPDQLHSRPEGPDGPRPRHRERQAPGDEIRGPGDRGDEGIAVVASPPGPSVGRELAELDEKIESLLSATAPDLMARFGVGPDTAASLLVAAGDNPRTVHSEAAWAHLCGVSPVPAGSGKSGRTPSPARRWRSSGQQRAVAHRHGPYRPRPRDDRLFNRRVKEGRTKRDVIRILQRYIAREVYRYLPRG